MTVISGVAFGGVCPFDDGKISEKEYRFDTEWKEFLGDKTEGEIDRDEFEFRIGLVRNTREINEDEFEKKYSKSAELLANEDIEHIIDPKHSIDIVPSLSEIPQNIRENFERTLKAARNLPANKEIIVAKGKTYIVDKE